jgi:putative PIN family toxin of toxin-antitoxin system
VRNEPNKAPSMVRVVIDTNILVSALIKRGKPRKLVLKLLEEHTVILSRQMLAELADVLTREKFAVKPSQVDRFLTILIRKSKIVKPSSHFKVIKEDPDDDVILNTAYAGKAQYIVTGDKHLLALKDFKRTKIVKVNQIIDSLNKIVSEH